MTSLPTRGAWIEIMMAYTNTQCPIVAPHAGSVDRNNLLAALDAQIR